jgi:uncharacterized protein YndB with AHSA1/START domain
MLARVYAVAAMLGALAAAQASALAPHEQARLEAGDVVVDIAADERAIAARIRAAIDIPAPPRIVWNVMTDCERAPRFVPGLESCRIVARDPGGRWDVREHQVTWAWFMPRVRNVFHSDYEAPARLRFHRVDGDLRRSEGEWRLEPLDNGRATRLVYDAIMAPGVPLPGFLVVEALRRDIPIVLRELRRESQSAAAQR